MMVVFFISLGLTARAQENDTPTPSPSATKELSRLEAFKELLTEKAKTPEGAMKLWFDALFTYMDANGEGDRKDGEAMLGLMTVDRYWKCNRFFLKQMKKRPYIFRSYAHGASPENNYEMNTGDYELEITRSFFDKEKNVWRLELKSSGADNSRAVYLKKGKDGLYRVQNFANIYVGVQPPQSGEK